MGFIEFLFNSVLIDPMLNILAGLYTVLFSNFGMAIIVFTIIVRLLTLPLQLKMTSQMKAMQGLQPRMREIQSRYSKDPQKRSQEVMRLYREAGVNPLGCLGPMFIQLPIWIGLYQALLSSLGTTPDHLIGLSQRVYSWNPLADAIVPINSNFLWLDLANPDPTPVLPVLVGVTTWAQQKMTTMPAADERQASTNRMMLLMMPFMLALFSFTFPSGLPLYWVISNLIGVAIQGFVTKDWNLLIPSFIRPSPAPEAIQPEPQQPEPEELEPKEVESDGRTSDVRENRRRGDRSGPERARRKPRRGRSRNNKPR